MSELRVVLAAVALMACFAVVGVAHRHHRHADCYALNDRVARNVCLWRAMTPQERTEMLHTVLASPPAYDFEIDP